MAGAQSVEPEARETRLARNRSDLWSDRPGPNDPAPAERPERNLSGRRLERPFDFPLLTAEWRHEMSEAFSYRIAVQFDPAGADHCFEFGFTVSTTLQ